MKRKKKRSYKEPRGVGNETLGRKDNCLTKRVTKESLSVLYKKLCNKSKYKIPPAKSVYRGPERS